MNKYKQLSEIQRYQIDALNKAQKDQKEIAKIISVSASTICRELKRNRGLRGYPPKCSKWYHWVNDTFCLN